MVRKAGSAFASYRRIRGHRAHEGVLPRSAPLVAGIALLAFTGTGGENTDVLAHLAGFVVGTAIGALCAHLPLPAPGQFRVQWIAGLAALALISLAWSLALA